MRPEKTPTVGIIHGNGRGDRSNAMTIRLSLRNEGRRSLRRRHSHRKKPSLSDFVDPKTVVLRKETPLPVGVDETPVRCERFLKHVWPSFGDGSRSVSIPEFWADGGCFHNLARTAVFFHVGKGGGGTIERELKLSRIGVSRSHPGPSPTHVRKLRKGPLTTLILNVRDPVDRYVSAFRWSIGMLCGPRKMHNKRCRSKLSSDYFRKETEEWLLMAEKYNADPNVLAEALCEESPLHREAEADFSKMWFMGHKRPLADWIGFLVDPEQEGRYKGIQELIALPMERQAGAESSFFGRHIERLALHLLQSRYDPELAEGILMKRPGDTNLSQKARQEHSTGTGQSPALSPLGECCMARKLRRDYQLIQTMLGQDPGNEILEPLSYAHPAVPRACSWGNEQQQELCRSDLRSIISRRARYFDRSLGTCHDAVPGTSQ